MAGKTELVVKNLENLAIEKICYYFQWCLIKYLLIFRLWVIIFTQERDPWQTFTYLKSLIETLKKVWICSKLTIKTLEQISAVFIVSFGHISHLFLVFLLLIWNK